MHVSLLSICCTAAGTYSNGYHWLGLSLLASFVSIALKINFAGVIKHKNKTNYWELKWLANCTVKIILSKLIMQKVKKFNLIALKYTNDHDQPLQNLILMVCGHQCH